jgi:hypothetical protein
LNVTAISARFPPQGNSIVYIVCIVDFRVRRESSPSSKSFENIRFFGLIAPASLRTVTACARHAVFLAAEMLVLEYSKYQKSKFMGVMLLIASREICPLDFRWVVATVPV